MLVLRDGVDLGDFFPGGALISYVSMKSMNMTKRVRPLEKGNQNRTGSQEEKKRLTRISLYCKRCAVRCPEESRHCLVTAVTGEKKLLTNPSARNHFLKRPRKGA